MKENETKQSDLSTLGSCSDSGADPKDVESLNEAFENILNHFK